VQPPTTTLVLRLDEHCRPSTARNIRLAFRQAVPQSTEGEDPRLLLNEQFLFIYDFLSSKSLPWNTISAAVLDPGNFEMKYDI